MSPLKKGIIFSFSLLLSCFVSKAQDTPWPGLNVGTIGCPASPSTSNTTSGASTDCGVSSAGDHIYQFTLATNADVTVDLCGSSYDTQLHLFDLSNGNCNAGAIASNDDNCGLQSSITMSCLSAGTYVIVVEGWSTSTGAYTLTVSTSNCGCTIPPTDCGGGTTVCNDQAFSGNSSGSGATQELTASNQGCLSVEHQSSWYFFEATSAGTLEFTISPQNGTDDYDFAVWGPYASGSTPGSICPPNQAPLRCSYAAGGGSTGLSNGAGDNTEGAGGDRWVEDVPVSAGDVFVLLIDNWSTSSQPFNLNWNLSTPGMLDCTPLPIELISFTGEGFSSYNHLKWTTAQEINNDYFVIMRSSDGITYEEIGFVDGAGNSSQINNYEFIDNDFENEVSYYRLKQVDYDGKSSYSNTISIHSTSSNIVSFFPNPATNVLNINIDNKINETLTIKYVNVLGSNTIIEKINVLQGMHTYTSNKFNELINGIYFVSVLDENNNVVKVDRIVKQ